MIKGVSHAHLRSIWYHSEPSGVSYFPNQFLALDFFVVSYSKTALRCNNAKHYRTMDETTEYCTWGTHVKSHKLILLYLLVCLYLGSFSLELSQKLKETLQDLKKIFKRDIIFSPCGDFSWVWSYYVAAVYC